MRTKQQITEKYERLLAHYYKFMYCPNGLEAYERFLQDYNAKFDKLVKRQLAAECERNNWEKCVAEVKILAWVLGRNWEKDVKEEYNIHN